jgi:hypothetical protein
LRLNSIDDVLDGINHIILGILVVDSGNIFLQCNMDVIKAECDRDIATNASSLDGKNMKQNVKEEPKDVSVAISNQEREVRKLTSSI